MNSQAKEIVALAEKLGFAFAGYDGSDHIVLALPDGRRTSIPATPSEYRGRKNAIATLERMSGRKLPRANHRRSRKSVKPSGFRLDRCESNPATTARIEVLNAKHDQQRDEWEALVADPGRANAQRARALLAEIVATEAELTGLHQPVDPIAPTP